MNLTPYERRVLNLDAHEEMPIPYQTGRQLINQGYYESIGANKGQCKDYRRRLPNDKGIHIRDYRDRMTMHWDHVDPSANLVGHLVRDAPVIALVGLAIGAAILGSGS
ncbi:hypothetical protein BRD56_04250 [Thermoplasmatales archaeon SW_10_69_26]|nr:MAG: hypothetical protein BRD56_04250 [Thermoplasmatales archaeon SW_10_69_26]